MSDSPRYDERCAAEYNLQLGLTLPQSVGFGIEYKATDDLILSVRAHVSSRLSTAVACISLKQLIGLTSTTGSINHQDHDR
jgi:hypothetical protein